MDDAWTIEDERGLGRNGSLKEQKARARKDFKSDVKEEKGNVPILFIRPVQIISAVGSRTASGMLHIHWLHDGSWALLIQSCTVIGGVCIKCAANKTCCMKRHDLKWLGGNPRNGLIVRTTSIRQLSVRESPCKLGGLYYTYFLYHSSWVRLNPIGRPNRLKTQQAQASSSEYALTLKTRAYIMKSSELPTIYSMSF